MDDTSSNPAGEPATGQDEPVDPVYPVQDEPVDPVYPVDETPLADQPPVLTPPDPATATEQGDAYEALTDTGKERADELIGQGVSRLDAIEQARYEDKLADDQQAPPQVTV